MISNFKLKKVKTKGLIFDIWFFVFVFRELLIQITAKNQGFYSISFLKGLQ